MKTWIQILLLIVGMTLGIILHARQFQVCTATKRKLTENYRMFSKALVTNISFTTKPLVTKNEVRLYSQIPINLLESTPLVHNATYPPTYNFPSSMHTGNPRKRGITSCTYGGKVTKIHIQLLPLHQESQSIIT